MIHLTPPGDFQPQFETVGAFVVQNGKFLLLQRQEHKPQGGTWGVPAGKIDPGEVKEQTMLRELQEETGLHFEVAQLHFHQSIFVRFPEYDFIYHIFSVELSGPVDIVLQPREHKALVWVTPQEALGMKLMPDLDGCMELYFRIPTGAKILS